MSKQFKEQVTLNDGYHIPKLGLGVWQATNEQASVSVREALLHGYRLIDTASIYGNEEGVGLGIKDSGLDRKKIFITTKVWNDAQGEKATTLALEQSLERLNLNYIDLYLIHWPAAQKDKYVETWNTLIQLKAQGLIRSIGVANFHEEHLKKLIHETNVVPTINQIEVHPYLQQHELRKVNQALNIQTQSWSPLAQNKAINDGVIEEIAKKHHKTPAQIIIRWHLQNDLILIPKTTNTLRIKENFDVFNFELDQNDLVKITSLDRGERLGPDPDSFE
ncbi:oxidoreductase [Acinetobacter sp. ANC 4558]|uniref:aldo/keto reductase n=1 Tax=Acinetobacter sp. ANC 4558 TaxID=1977876 RepID=UPI000A332863|nr:aldo/keto reductase [Acinetobacter sp. ANC 4558]OTG86131.1 oxidoreductase [Acinetobacter sp. ANC 4558]